MRTRNKHVFAAGITAAVMTLVFSFVQSFIPEVTTTTVVKTDSAVFSGLTAGIQTVLDVAEESDVHEEITEVLNEGVVQNNLPGYDWNDMAIANVEDSVNMREEPDQESEMVGKLPKGAAGTIIDGCDGWTKLSSGSVEGWVSDEFLLFGTDAEEMAEELGSYQATITTDALRIRMEPAEDAGVYDLAENGATYMVAEELDGWVAIQLDSDIGYVSSEFVNIEFVLPSAKSIEEIRAEEEKAKQEAEEAAKEAEEEKRKEAEEKAANSSDVAVLAALVQLEAGGESYEGKLAVASVVMNRVRSGSYPNSVSGVVYQSGQFPPASTARMASLVASGASSDCVKAAKQAIGGVSNVGSLTHFHAAGLGGDLVIGNHAFY